MPTLLSALSDALTAAEAAAATALTDTQAKMDAAVAAIPTPAGDCLESMVKLDDAWSAVSAAFDAAGRAEALRDIVEAGTLSATVLTLPPATGNIDLSSIAALAATKATAATNHAQDARVYVLTREQLVRDAFKGCVTAGVLGPLLGVAQACVSAARDALNAAVNNLADPGPPPGRAALPNSNLQGMVTALINRSTQPVSDDGLQGCNAGVLDLKNATDIISNAEDKRGALTACLGELGAIAPADPLIGLGNAALTSAKTQIDNANAQLHNDTSGTPVFGTWLNRVNCLLKEQDIIVKVRDESGDEMGQGVQVSVHNPVIDALLPLPVIPAPTECPGSQITLHNVPMAAIPLAPPAGAPAKPPGIPDLPAAATLVFNVARGGGRTFSAAVDPGGLLMGADRKTITLQLDEVSSLTSC